MSGPDDLRDYSIGEVLTLLRDEFPDVTISKIRFLESQGLIDPERTPSGYRKFHEPDLQRLRWVLLQQKEHFLPLKVIKERLERDGIPTNATERDGGGRQRSSGGRSARSRERRPRSTSGASEPSSPSPAESPATATPAPPAPRVVRRATTPPLPFEEFLGDDGDDPLDVSITGGTTPSDDGGSSADARRELTRSELARVAGLTEHQIDELESYGLLRAISGTADGASYGAEAEVVAKLASGFIRHGVQARHLRVYLHTAEREAGLYAQLLLPLVKQRNPQSREKAQRELAELARLGRRLRGVLLYQSMRTMLDE